MKNPYQQLYIYYLNGIPAIDRDILQSEPYLGTWEDDGVCFVFFSQPSRPAIKRILSSDSGISLIDTFEMTGEEWHGDQIEPYHLADFYIFPPWHKPKITSPGTKKIVLDPGVVFGTGRHPTTEDCLYLVHRLFSRMEVRSTLDIGTGTGLLSLAAAAMGCPRVMACDFNFLAARTAWQNIRLNRLENTVLAFQARGEEILSMESELLIANIHYDVMRHLIESPHFLDKKYIILSGLLHSETRRVMDTLSRKKVHIVERRCPDGIWNTLLVRPVSNDPGGGSSRSR